MSIPRLALMAGTLIILVGGPGLAADESPTPTYPGDSWAWAESPKTIGWSAAGLDSVADYVQSIQSAAFIIVQGGVVVASWGTLDHPYSIASARKSLLSALIGNAVQRGEIDLQATLADLGIDDNPPALTSQEKQARVVDLLCSRSGIYHPAAYEPRQMKDQRPERGSHPPGTSFFYNNWDFNTLGTIYEQQTGRGIFEAFEQEIARPLGMQDYAVEDGRYVKQDKSEHAAYVFRMSARDLARFGLLFLRDGKWNDVQVVPFDWVHESTSAQFEGPRGSYGFMWWVETDSNHYRDTKIPHGSFIARGTGGHHLVVIPSLDLVVVHQGETDKPAPGNWVGEYEVDQLLGLVLKAMIPNEPE